MSFNVCHLPQWAINEGSYQNTLRSFGWEPGRTWQGYMNGVDGQIASIKQLYTGDYDICYYLPSIEKAWGIDLLSKKRPYFSESCCYLYALSRWIFAKFLGTETESIVNYVKKGPYDSGTLQEIIPLSKEKKSRTTPSTEVVAARINQQHVQILQNLGVLSREQTVQEANLCTVAEWKEETTELIKKALEKHLRALHSGSTPTQRFVGCLRENTEVTISFFQEECLPSIILQTTHQVLNDILKVKLKESNKVPTNLKELLTFRTVVFDDKHPVYLSYLKFLTPKLSPIIRSTENKTTSSLFFLTWHEALISNLIKTVVLPILAEQGDIAYYNATGDSGSPIALV